MRTTSQEPSGSRQVLKSARVGRPAWVLNVTECSWQAGNVRLLRNWTVAGSAPAPPEGVKPAQPPGLSGPACRAGPFLHFPALREAPMQ